MSLYRVHSLRPCMVVVVTLRQPGLTRAATTNTCLSLFVARGAFWFADAAPTNAYVRLWTLGRPFEATTCYRLQGGSKAHWRPLIRFLDKARSFDPGVRHVTACRLARRINLQSLRTYRAIDHHSEPSSSCKLKLPITTEMELRHSLECQSRIKLRQTRAVLHQLMHPACLDLLPSLHPSKAPVFRYAFSKQLTRSNMARSHAVDRSFRLATQSI